MSTCLDSETRHWIRNKLAVLLLDPEITEDEAVMIHRVSKLLDVDLNEDPREVTARMFVKS